MRLEIHPSAAYGSRARGHAVETLAAALDARASASWVLAGGRSPMPAYAALARDPDGVDWSRVALLMGDERLVPLQHPDSNWGTVLGALRVAAPLDRAILMPPKTDGTAEEAAAVLVAQLADRRLDLLWAGCGEDGHTLGIFPGAPSLVSAADVVAIHDSPKPPAERFSMTLAAAARAQTVVVFVVGEGKREAYRGLLAGDERLPVVRLVAATETAGGDVLVIADEAAAG